MPKINIFVLIVVLAGLNSCDPNMVYDHLEKTKNQNWNAKDIKHFEVDIQDSLNYHNVYVNIRHTKDYPKSNLYLFVTITGPNENEIRDTIDIPIANKHGKWFGSGFGEIKFVRKKIKKQVIFAHKGKYFFDIEQGMRLEEVPVTDIGLRIEKFNPVN